MACPSLIAYKCITFKWKNLSKLGGGFKFFYFFYIAKSKRIKKNKNLALIELDF